MRLSRHTMLGLVMLGGSLCAFSQAPKEGAAREHLKGGPRRPAALARKTGNRPPVVENMADSSQRREQEPPD